MKNKRKSNGKIIGVDVDLTVVDSDTPWLEWYKKLTGHELGEITAENNDLENLMHKHDDPHEFWRKPDLYDDLDAFDDARYFLKMLHDEGYRIVFISACFPEHEKSKKHFLKRNFDFEFGFISTTDKQYLRLDYFIDDYKKYCQLVNDHNDDCNVFQHKTSINKKGNFAHGDWGQFYDFVQKSS